MEQARSTRSSSDSPENLVGPMLGGEAASRKAVEEVSMRDLQRQAVQELIGKGAQVVEVLPASEYEEDHLPGAINIGLREIDKEAPSKLDNNAPVVVYCWDSA